MVIRPETPADTRAIYALTKAAFAPKAYSDGTEQDCINQMRADGDLEISLVAEVDGVVLGHVAFSKLVSIGGTDTQWRGLGPVAVLPDHQRRGIGSLLINQGLAQLRAAGCPGCALIGDPKYYSRFGFVGTCGLTYQDLPQTLVQALPFGTDHPVGELLFAPGLET